MTEAIAAVDHDRRLCTDGSRARLTRKHVRRLCAVGAFAFALAAAPVAGLGTPALSHADDCGPGWVWSDEANQCVFWGPAANGPIGVGGVVGPVGVGPVGPGPVGPGGVVGPVGVGPVGPGPVGPGPVGPGPDGPGR